MTQTPTEARIYEAGLELRGTETVNGIEFLHGRAVPYNTVADIGWYLEEHAPGSFKKSIKEAARGLPLLMFHDSRTFPVGVIDKWDDNDEALDGIWRLDKDSEEAQRAGRLATPDENGRSMLGYMSISFAPIKSEWTEAKDWNPELGPEHKDRVTRLQSRLVEVSLVSTPAFKEATINFTRTADSARRRDRGASELAAWRRELEALRNPPDTPTSSE
jgi:HK97 family phage prohead protease